MTGFNQVADILRKEEEKESKNAFWNLLSNLIILFFYPFIVMKGWDAIAWHFNLPMFDYWQMFCITHGIRILLGRGM